MDKFVVIINGAPESGKDTLCEYILEQYKGRNVSSITPIKEIALDYGWDGKKNEKSREFLSELKNLFIRFNDMPTNYLVDHYYKFLESDETFMFAHIREPEEIEKFYRKIKNLNQCSCITLLITRPNHTVVSCGGNDSDNRVNEYKYDYRFSNDLELSESKEYFLKLIKLIISYEQTEYIKKNGVIKNGSDISE